jgi:hypothetical protein
VAGRIIAREVDPLRAEDGLSPNGGSNQGAETAGE